LAEAVARLYSKFLDRQIDPSTEVLITIGADEALFCAIMSNVNPGDEVIVIEPFYDIYAPMIKIAGGSPRFIPLRLVRAPS
jgi:kynurenine--oxoglutarate transaminase/cysteine-S-conjugate beta-lyase/glutamine--phenylpyruvate transaminase